METFQLIQDIFSASHHISMMENFRKQVCSFFTASTDLFPVIVGPCSISHAKGFLLYLEKLARLQEKVKDQIFFIVRAFYEKSRSSHSWKGYVYDPFLTGKDDLRLGIQKTRKLLIKALDFRLPLATEVVSPEIFHFFSDLYSWIFIGARTNLSMKHRIFASSLSLPVSFKNTLDGNLCLSAKAPHVSMFPHEMLDLYAAVPRVITTKGNPYSHLCLRGSTYGTNYDESSIFSASSYLSHLSTFSKVLVDTSHGNSGKNPDQQKVAFQYLLDHFPTIESHLLGISLESYLEKGNQPFHSHADPHISITDPCLNFAETTELMFMLADVLANKPLTKAAVQCNV